MQKLVPADRCIQELERFYWVLVNLKCEVQPTIEYFDKVKKRLKRKSYSPEDATIETLSKLDDGLIQLIDMLNDRNGYLQTYKERGKK